MAPNTVPIGSLSREIDKLKSTNRALIGLLIDLHRVTYANARASNASEVSLTLIQDNGEILKRLLDAK